MLLTLPTWLALSATLLTPTTAFYPYQFDNNSPSSHRRTIPRAPSPTDTSITLPLRRVPRQNVYSIINSADPKQANSVAIDQDGSDLSYMVAVRIGDSKEEYHLLLDSAASNTWVMSQDCKTEACGTHNTFGKGDSGSLKVRTCPVQSSSLLFQFSTDMSSRHKIPNSPSPTALAVSPEPSPQTQCTSAPSPPP